VSRLIRYRLLDVRGALFITKNTKNTKNTNDSKNLRDLRGFVIIVRDNEGYLLGEGWVEIAGLPINLRISAAVALFARSRGVFPWKF
jgi:hypothetical protein